MWNAAHHLLHVCEGSIIFNTFVKEMRVKFEYETEATSYLKSKSKQIPAINQLELWTAVGSKAT